MEGERRMEFGFWDHFEHRPGVPLNEQYAEKVQLIVEAERLGFTYFQVAEHHCSPLAIAPSPSVFLAAAAQATSTIRIGTGVYCLPMYHPIRLVQEICMLDQISNGRLDVGVGRGIRAIEHEWFGIPQEEAAPRYHEVLDILVQGLTHGSITYHGQFFDFDEVPIDVEPYQKPHPPLWYAGGTENAGRGGFNFLCRGTDDVVRYWELWDETRQRPDRMNAHLEHRVAAITRHVVVRETYEDAVAVARRSWPTFEAHWFSTPVRLTEEGAPVPREQMGVGEDFDEALRRGKRLIVGTPAIVRETLEQWCEEVDGTPGFDFMPAIQWGDITTDEAMETLSLLATEVLPAFRGVPA
jgi:alkanesulfonate monooxygenase SsuD/methylene tetrahydromethanopterin reductase-like flavin-dependent oxidoreductase (luciferase family)